MMAVDKIEWRIKYAVFVIIFSSVIIFAFPVLAQGSGVAEQLPPFFDIAYIIIIFFLAFAAGFILNYTIKRIDKNYLNEKKRNKVKASRPVRIVFGLVIFILGIYTWNPILLFFAGFCFYETIFNCNLLCAIIDKVRNVFLKS